MTQNWAMGLCRGDTGKIRIYEIDAPEKSVPLTNLNYRTTAFACKAHIERLQRNALVLNEQYSH